MTDAHGSTPAELKARLEAERGAHPFLLYRDAGGGQRIVALDAGDAPVTVGRREDNAIALPWDNEVSRLHAELAPIGRDWVVIDDGLSRNGTFVNGDRITGRRRLRDGDRLCFGETPMQFRAPTDDSSASTASVPTGGAALMVTDTQRRVLVALCRPLRDSPYAVPATNREIADEVHLSVDAVKAHLRVLFERLGLDELPQNQEAGAAGVRRARRRRDPPPRPLEPAQLGVEVRPGAALAAALADRALEGVQRGLDHGAVGLQAALLAVAQPVDGRGVPARAVAGPAGGDLVLGPRRPALQPRHDVLQRGEPVPGLERAPAPHALVAVAIEDPPQALGSRQLGRDRYSIVCRTHSPSWRPSVSRCCAPSPEAWKTATSSSVPGRSSTSTRCRSVGSAPRCSAYKRRAALSRLLRSQPRSVAAACARSRSARFSRASKLPWVRRSCIARATAPPTASTTSTTRTTISQVGTR
jgi:hypothetical protein